MNVQLISTKLLLMESVFINWRDLLFGNVVIWSGRVFHIFFKKIFYVKVPIFLQLIGEINKLLLWPFLSRTNLVTHQSNQIKRTLQINRTLHLLSFNFNNNNIILNIILFIKKLIVYVWQWKNKYTLYINR